MIVIQTKHMIVIQTKHMIIEQITNLKRSLHIEEVEIDCNDECSHHNHNRTFEKYSLELLDSFIQKKQKMSILILNEQTERNKRRIRNVQTNGPYFWQMLDSVQNEDNNPIEMHSTHTTYTYKWENFLENFFCD